MQIYVQFYDEHKFYGIVIKNLLIFLKYIKKRFSSFYTLNVSKKKVRTKVQIFVLNDNIIEILKVLASKSFLATEYSRSYLSSSKMQSLLWYSVHNLFNVSKIRKYFCYTIRWHQLGCHHPNFSFIFLTRDRKMAILVEYW